MRVGVKIVIASHEILPQKDARVEPAFNFRIDFLGIIHKFFKFFGECDHSFGECGQQFLDKIEIFIKLLAIDHNGFSFEVIKRHLKINLLKFLNKSLSLFLLIEFHLKYNCK